MVHVSLCFSQLCIQRKNRTNQEYYIVVVSLGSTTEDQKTLVRKKRRGGGVVAAWWRRRRRRERSKKRTKKKEEKKKEKKKREREKFYCTVWAPSCKKMFSVMFFSDSQISGRVRLSESPKYWNGKTKNVQIASTKLSRSKETN